MLSSCFGSGVQSIDLCMKRRFKVKGAPPGALPMPISLGISRAKRVGGGGGGGGRGSSLSA